MKSPFKLRSLGCELFDGADCTGVSLADPVGFSSFENDTEGEWIAPSTIVTTPTGTESALCVAQFFTAEGWDFDARVDQVELIDQSLIFADGFETGDASTWDASVP